MYAATHAVETSVNQWGNGLAIRLTKAVAKAAGMTEGAPVRVTAQAGRIVVEACQPKPSLEAMLAGFDPQRHGGEAMAFAPVGVEVL